MMFGLVLNVKKNLKLKIISYNIFDKSTRVQLKNIPKECIRKKLVINL